jgi:hypothetical protein
MPYCRKSEQQLTFVQTTEEKMPTVLKIKRVATPTHKANAFAAHLILPNRTNRL